MKTKQTVNLCRIIALAVIIEFLMAGCASKPETQTEKKTEKPPVSTPSGNVTQTAKSPAVPQTFTSVADFRTWLNTQPANTLTTPYLVELKVDNLANVRDALNANKTKYVSIDLSGSTVKGLNFYGCPNLASITIPDSVTSIGEAAFQGCTSLTSITIPNSVASIGKEAFFNCTSLANVTIPNSVTYIGEKAFYDCIGLTSITIPNSVTRILKNAFRGCTRTRQVTVTEIS
jgi:hypothetical protein